MDDLITAGNRVEIKEWDFKNHLHEALAKMDRYFYVHYSSIVLAEVEKARADESIKKKSLLERVSKRATGSQFVLEYEGVKGMNKLGGHRQKMTDRVNRTFYQITKKNLNKISIDRHEANGTILMYPFGGLEVAYQLVYLIRSQDQTAAKHYSEKLALAYEIEVWKRIFYWTVFCYSMEKKELYDIFNLSRKESLFPGSITKKLSDLFSFADTVKDPSLKYLMKYHLFSYVTQAQDYIMQEEEELTEVEAHIDKKVLLDMLLKHPLFLIDKRKKGTEQKVTLKPQEQKILFSIYPFHPARVKKTISYFMLKRTPRNLAWQCKLLPDVNFFHVINTMEEKGRKTLLKEIQYIIKAKKKASERENAIINKLENKVKKVSVVNSSSDIKISGVQTIRDSSKKSDAKEEATAVGGENAKVTEIELTPENVSKLEQLSATPFLTDIQLIQQKISVCASNLVQVLFLNNKMIYNKAVGFLDHTAQFPFEEAYLTSIWKNKDKFIDEPLSPMERITLSDLNNNLPEEGIADWKELNPTFYIKVGKSTNLIKSYEENTVSVLNKAVSGASQISEQSLTVQDFLSFPESDAKLWIDSFTENNILNQEEAKNVLNCWKVFNYKDEQVIQTGSEQQGTS